MLLRKERNGSVPALPWKERGEEKKKGEEKRRGYETVILRNVAS